MNLCSLLKIKKNCLRIQNELFPLKAEGISTPYLLFDFAKCYFYHGCNLDQYVRGGFYKLKGCERLSYLTYGRICKVYDWSIDGNYVPYLEHKATFNKHFSRYINRKWLYSKDMNYEQFDSLCNSVDAVIVKPIDGHQGEGIYKVKMPCNDVRKLYDKVKNVDCVIEECISSHDDMTFGGASLNTIRIHTFMDKNGMPHIEKILLRVGVGSSVVDNYCSGGCVYEVDQEKGIIISCALSRVNNGVYVQPGTNIVMLGKQIPNLNDVKNLVVSAHKLLPQIKFIGWDVAITNQGVELIEGNHHADYEFYEFIGRRGWWTHLKEYLKN